MRTTNIAIKRYEIHAIKISSADILWHKIGKECWDLTCNLHKELFMHSRMVSCCTVIVNDPGSFGPISAFENTQCGTTAKHSHKNITTA